MTAKQSFAWGGDEQGPTDGPWGLGVHSGASIFYEVQLHLVAQHDPDLFGPQGLMLGVCQ